MTPLSLLYSRTFISHNMNTAISFVKQEFR